MREKIKEKSRVVRVLGVLALLLAGMALGANLFPRTEQVTVERVVERRVEVPVERIIERTVVKSADPTTRSTHTPSDRTGAQPTPSPTKETTEAAPNVIIHTNYGDMTVEFWPDVAPKTVANFLKLSREGYYTGTAFHRIIKGFMIQGGCPNSKVGARGVAGTGGPGYQIKAEFNNRAHVRGVLSMARSSDPDSAGSQFFICHGNADFLNNKYTAFGKLVSGQDVLDKIAAIPCVGQERSNPTERVEIKSVEIVREAPAKDAKAK